MDTIADIANEFGTQREMADAIGVSRGCVEQWCRRNSVSSKMLVKVVHAAQGRRIELTIDRLAEIVASDTGQAV